MLDILLIESDRVLAKNIIKIFKKRGHNIEWQVNPQLALDRADNNMPDAIILDLVLAGRGGIEFLYEFRSYPDWQNVPIVLYSSLSPEELKNVASGFEHLNVTAYLYKPTTSISQLAMALENIVQPAPA